MLVTQVYVTGVAYLDAESNNRDAMAAIDAHHEHLSY